MPRNRAPITGLPPRLSGLWQLATDLSWSWSREARAVFRTLDPIAWAASRYNPIALLQMVEEERLLAVAEDPEYLALYDRAIELRDRSDSADETWFADNYPDLKVGPVAYFCAEFALHDSVPIYSGGLGVLAGDHCKAASDLGVPLIGVGLFYTRGYFDQALRTDGWQEAIDDEFDANISPLEPLWGPRGTPFLTTVTTAGRPVRIAVWRMKVGRVSIYLLDTDVEQNRASDRELSHKLYSGGAEMRLRQEWILGVGGVRVLRSLDIHPSAWHANEGHAAFMMVERVREMTSNGVPLEEAVSTVRATSVFTTHTPVPAGHDSFTREQMNTCTGTQWKAMSESRDRVLGFGHHPVEDHGVFHMTAAAIRLSRRVNGVSELHGAVARDIWKDLWPDRKLAEVPIGHVTNGVHLASWMAPVMMRLLDDHFGPGWGARRDEPEFWDGVLSLDDEVLWWAHQRLQRYLFNFLRGEARRKWQNEWRDAAHLVSAGTLQNAGTLTLGFARRFATYKRADLIFSDEDRLRRIVTHARRPIQIVFAGKAHPADEEGKRVLQRIFNYAGDARFAGRIAFLEDYQLRSAHYLVQGVDLWLNVPRVPMEASGTSGMKAALNGIPQLSTTDGWWAEGFTGGNGWTIPVAPDGSDADALDVEHVYDMLENEVAPLYYDRDDRDVPVGWVQVMKEAIRIAGRDFTARRMMEDYVRGYYVPAMLADEEGDDPPTV